MPVSARRKILLSRTVFVLAGLVTGSVVTLGLVAFLPVSHPPFTTKVRSIPDLAGAISIVEEPDYSGEELRAECHGTVLDHGARTSEVYLLLHGLTNCPAQFRAFGELLYANGANVLIPRTPFHGFANRMNTAQSKLTAQMMIDSASEAINASHALGDRVTVIGLSVSAVTAAWLAQERNDLDRVVIIAPMFSKAGTSPRPLAGLASRLPNLFFWWDPKLKGNLEGSPNSYPRFASRPLGDILLMGMDLFEKAKETAPATRKMLVVTSPADNVINLDLADEIVTLWNQKVPGSTKTYHFPSEWNAPHDCIDPREKGQKVDLVYPALIEQIAKMR